MRQLPMFRGAKERVLALLLLILLPFPISIPLGLWLTGRYGAADRPSRLDSLRPPPRDSPLSDRQKPVSSRSR